MLEELFIQKNARYTVLVCASDFAEDSFVRLYQAGIFHKVIAVDAGYSHVSQLGIVPDIILGDFDSLGYVPDDKSVKVYPTEKDQSDYELALSTALGFNVQGVIVYGALGGRLDHTIAAIQVSSRFAQQGLDIILAGVQEAGYFLVGNEQASKGIWETDMLPLGQMISVFSLSDISVGVSEQGLRYTLSDESLTNATSRGLSNEGIGQPARISVKKGTLFLLATR